MDPLNALLAALSSVVILWMAMAAYVVGVERRRAAMRHILASALETLGHEGLAKLAETERRARIAALLAGTSRDLILSVAARPETPDAVFALLCEYLVAGVDRGSLERAAQTHRSARERWRRTAALRVLARLDHPASLPLLAAAIDQADEEVAATAFALLGASRHPVAMDLLIGALKAQKHPASLVAVHIEQSPQDVPERLRTLLDDTDPVVRLWAATLLARYPEEPFETALAERTSDSDPRVRKAAIQTMGRIGGDRAADCALRLLKDQFPYVRAHAARALGELGRIEAAEEVAELLGDGNWWVRLAAKESLEAMGSDVWPVLMRCLNHDDRFIRNGAAEVFQNLGVLDSLIVMEAASDNPAPLKIAMLQRIAAAGGVQFTDSLVERSGPIIGPRIRQLLATIGLDHVEAR